MPGVQEPSFDFGEPATRNHGLFADHLLDHGLAGLLRPLDFAVIDAAFVRIQALYEEHVAGLEVASEAQVEHDFVRPVLVERS
jgi:hypothetical protein